MSSSDAKHPPIMEPEVEKNDTTFRLIFPKYVDFDISSALEYETVDAIFNGDDLNVILVAEYSYKATEDDTRMRNWREKIRTFEVDLNITLDPVIHSQDTPDCVKLLNLKSHKDGIRCYPRLKKQDRLKKKNEWVKIKPNVLAFQKSLVIHNSNLSSGSHGFKVWLTVWSPVVDTPDQTDVSILHECLNRYPDIPDSALTKKDVLFKYIDCKHVKLKPVPEMTCWNTNVGTECYIFIKVVNKMDSAIEVHNIKCVSDHGMDCNINAELQHIDLPAQVHPLESQTFIFKVAWHYQEDDPSYETQNEMLSILLWRSQENSTNNQDIPLITTQYRLPTIQVRHPGLIIAAVPSTQHIGANSFNMDYIITNNLQDFTSLKLVWSPEKALKDPRGKTSEVYRSGVRNVMERVVCEDPVKKVGALRRGEKATASVGFHTLKSGVFELCQHMKLNLQYQDHSKTYYQTHSRSGSNMSTHSIQTNQSSQSHRGTPMGSQPDAKSSFPGTPTESSSIHSSRASPSVHSPSLHTPDKSHSAVSSPVLPRGVPFTGPITPQQVLKRNCQVFVQDSRDFIIG